jgi:hypothetical protein
MGKETNGHLNNLCICVYYTMNTSEEDDLPGEHLWEPGPTGRDIVFAFDDLPIQARLEFVRNLLLNHGGERRSAPCDPVLVVAAEVLRGVVRVLKDHPKVAQLRGPKI